MLTIRALTGGATYASHHLRANDYYSEKEQVVGRWMGRGAEMLGLQGEVQMVQFDALREGLHPLTQEHLRPRHSADRTNEYGEVVGKARNLYDFTVSAPKSVSIQAMVDPRLADAHSKAIAETAAELESLAAARVRQKGANEDRTTGNLVIAAYQHDTSRELDPQLHTHLVAANLTYDGAEGRWKALQASDIYDQRAYLTEVYRNALAREVNTLGYRIEDRFHEGKERGFEVEGIPLHTIEKFSQRSAERDAAVQEFYRETGRYPTDNEVSVLVRDSRTPKMYEISTEEVRKRQQDRLTPAEAVQLSILKAGAVDRGSIREWQPAGPSLDYAQRHVFERVSVAKEHELKTEALRFGRGHIDLSDLQVETVRLGNTGKVLKAGNDVATKESLAREMAMIASVNAGQGRHAPLGGDQPIRISEQLNAEQKTAVNAILTSRDLVVNLSGAAGSGKTATLQEIRHGLEQAGHELVAVAPTRSAVEELHKVGFDQAQTIQRLLKDRSGQEQLKGKILIVDEAGMIGSSQMSSLLDLVKQQGARIVFSGDTRQIQSVEAGDALRVLERESQMMSVPLRQIQRQTVREYREAVQELRRQPEQGFAKLEQMGAMREVKWKDRAREVSQAYRQAQSQANSKGQQPSVLVVAPTHEEIRRVTEAIRMDRKQAKELGESISVDHYVPMNWTKARQQEVKNYRPGMVLQFHKRTKEVAPGDSLEITRVEGHRIIARKDSGQEVALTRRQTQAFSVQERHKLDVAPGDRLLLQGNRRGKDFHATNGELVTVDAVVGGRIQLADGRLLPSDYQQFTYGYAVTAHRGQGKTVDRVIVSGDQMSQELFYVAATRGREGLTVLTSDKERLRESIGVSGERQSATELARKSAKNTSRMPEWALRPESSVRNEKRVERATPVYQVELQEETGISYGIGR